jgi:hypothetical protein
MSKLDISTQRLLDSEGTRQQITKTALRSRFQRFNQLKDELLFHYWFAGGAGSPILRAAIKSCRHGDGFSRKDIRRFVTRYEAGERQRRAKRMDKSRLNGIRRQRTKRG